MFDFAAGAALRVLCAYFMQRPPGSLNPNSFGPSVESTFCQHQAAIWLGPSKPLGDAIATQRNKNVSLQSPELVLPNGNRCIGVTVLPVVDFCSRYQWWIQGENGGGPIDTVRPLKGNVIPLKIALH